MQISNKWLTPIALLSGLFISGVAAYFSILGLTKLFASAAIAVAIFGASIEIGKLVTASWLFHNWRTAPRLLKSYMISAVVVLMLITSLGIWGYLNKSYADQTAPMQATNIELSTIKKELDIQQQRVIDAKKNIDQINNIIDKRISSDKDDLSARNRLAKDRLAAQTEIKEANKEILRLQKESAKLETSNQVISHEVGPINYIAKLIYGNSDPTAVDKAVQFVIILLVLVFDPLAIALLLAANFSMKREVVEPAVPSLLEGLTVEPLKPKIETEPEIVVEEVSEPLPDFDEIKEVEERLPQDKGIGEVIYHPDGSTSYKG